MTENNNNISQLQAGDALLIIDMQNDFLPGGALSVADGDQVIAPLIKYIQAFHDKNLPIFASRDWHPIDHKSFQEQGGPWPPHCVQGSKGAQFVAALALPVDVSVISTGYRAELEGYSAFEGSDLDVQLKGAGIKRLFVGGLATDYCVFHSVKEALGFGFEVCLIHEAVRAVNVNPDDGAKATDQMVRLGARLYTGSVPH